MERVQVLIDKLVEQKQQSAKAAQMLVTVQLLQKELQMEQQKASVSGSAKVSVVMPGNASAQIIREPVIATTVAQPQKQEEQEEIPTPAAMAPKPEVAPEPVGEYIFQKPVINYTRPVKTREEAAQPASHSKFDMNDSAYLPFDPVAETPTLLQHQPKKELHEVIASPNEQPSLNDRLKQEKTELGQVLKEAPIKDLRKAVGINDKFVFVNELFRGDEAMYDRSMKTINGFHILPEAEYWINRELKVKLGWNDSKDVVQHFYQLVRRRFA